MVRYPTEPIDQVKIDQSNSPVPVWNLADYRFLKDDTAPFTVNSKAVYQRYIGWYDANPATLHALPPVDASKRYVDYMGGAETVLDKAQQAFERGEYRWVAEVVNHVIFAAPTVPKSIQLIPSRPMRNFFRRMRWSSWVTRPSLAHGAIVI